MKKLLLLMLICASANAQETARYPENLTNNVTAFWQLTMVTQTEMLDIGPEGGWGFYSRIDCIKEGMRRMKGALAQLTDDDWGVSPLLGFICEYTIRKKPTE